MYSYMYMYDVGL